MRYSEIVTEAPQIIPPTNFGMSDKEQRLRYTNYLLSVRPRELIEETEQYTLYKAGTGSVVHFFMLEKVRQQLVYFVKCETAYMSFVGPSVTQVILWRDDLSLSVVGITKKVFFLLLETWPTIVSDEQQTQEGMNFWGRRLAEADASGLKVGLANTYLKTIDWKPPEMELSDWVNENMNAWSSDPKSKRYRFVISRASAMPSNE